MNNLTYRQIERRDLEDVKVLIREAFKYDRFVKNEEVLELILDMYVKECLLDSSFGMVAENRNKIVGVILGSAYNDSQKLGTIKDRLELDKIMKLANKSKECVELLKAFDRLGDTYKNFIAGREDSFDGCLKLFIVDKECRGLGVGTTLMDNLFEYMNDFNVKKIYLYTDDQCNYKFYDVKNFIRLEERFISQVELNFDMMVYLYEYDLKSRISA